jgi:hypothetical protein
MDDNAAIIYVIMHYRGWVRRRAHETNGLGGMITCDRERKRDGGEVNPERK